MRALNPDPLAFRKGDAPASVRAYDHILGYPNLVSCFFMVIIIKPHDGMVSRP